MPSPERLLTMEDLSLHILDIAENSLAAEARSIGILLDEDSARDVLTLTITDDGKGMDAEMLGRATDPFTTTRSTRRVGLGLSLLAEAAAAAQGTMTVRSAPALGTTVTATFRLGHIDRKPLGRIADTLATLIAARPEVEITYEHRRDGRSFRFTTMEVRRELDGEPLNAAEILMFIRRYLTQEETALTSHD